MRNARSRPVYRAAAQFVAAASASPFFEIAGATGRKVRMLSIRVTGPTLTAVGYHSIQVGKYSANTTVGTATDLTKVPLDSKSPPSIASVCRVFTAAPTVGAIVGLIGSQRILAQATTAAAAGTVDGVAWDFGQIGDAEGAVLLTAAEAIALTFAAAPATAVTMSIEVEWTEE